MGRKAALKKEVLDEQGGVCALSEVKLPKDKSLTDTDRIRPKAKGGIYTLPNTRVVDPVEHMKRHDNYRVRDAVLEELKSLIDDREQVRKVTMKVNNQLLAYKRRTDTLQLHTVAFLTAEYDKLHAELKDRDAKLVKAVKALEKVDPFVRSCFSVRGIGPITVAYCMVYIDLAQARHASCLWSYAGLHRASHERYQKGVKGGGNKSLRVALWTMADSMMKTRGAYRYVYDNVKTRLENSDKIVTSRDTKGHLVQVAWKDAKACHRHGAALRAIMKHFLADYWMVGRKYAGLPVGPLYPEAMLGGTHKTVMPEERGWVMFDENMKPIV